MNCHTFCDMIYLLKIDFNRIKQRYFMSTNESVENYLETILILNKRSSCVRSIDIANELGFKKSSVSVAMKNLRQKNYILVSDEGYISLTPSGKEIADMILERHLLLSGWLEHLGVSKEIAAQDACKIEHIISQASFDALKKHIELSDFNKQQ